ncbi:MAG TPA: class I SAM-dependent RNA methyltransferase [Clostridiaceae bacterium]|nr:class I SAM-dependent RNA methyltransferase [Clostridiaceae bacterium]
MTEQILQIIDLTDQGEGLAKTEQGQVVFVPYTVPGDVIKAEIFPLKKNIWQTKNIKIIEESANRQSIPCPHFSVRLTETMHEDVSKELPEKSGCGGCQVQALNYANLISAKENILRSQLERIAQIDLTEIDFRSIISMQNPWHYRNNVQLKVQYNVITKQFEFGFFAQKSNEIIVHQKCLISQTTDSIICQVINQKLSQAEPELHSCLIEFWNELIIRTGENSKIILVALSFKKLDKSLLKIDYKPVWQEIFNTINSKLSELSENYTLRSLWLLDQENSCNDKLLFGEKYFTEIILGKHFQIYPRSFFQVNTRQTEVMFRTIRKFMINALRNKNNSPDISLEKTQNDSCNQQEDNKFQENTATLYDLYCGTGTIGIILSDLFKQIKGVDSFPSSIQNAKQNAQLNSINNAEYFLDKAEDWLDGQQISEQDFIIVDPPRKGLDKTLINTLNQSKASNLIYVSCHPGTLSRDLKLLKDEWQIKVIQPIDMFPWTMHIECIVWIQKKNRIIPVTRYNN